MQKTKYNLIRPKSDNYKKEQPEMEMAAFINESGETTMVADFEVFYENYPLKIPMVIYDEKIPHIADPLPPYIRVNNELWVIRGFIQVGLHKVNIHCGYCGITEGLPMTKWPE